MSEWIGQTLGKVRIEKLIARGGMAEVYYGLHTSLNRPAAVKVMLSHLEAQPELKSRFEREARVLAGLRHPNIIQIYDFDVVDDQPYIVMEYIEGPTLATYLRAMRANAGRLNLRQIGRLLVMIASALDYAHAKGVVHRDIKPANILMTSKSALPDSGQPLTEDTEPILTDFGLLLLTDGSAKSISGIVTGTPDYMSPEQARGERVGPRSDLYSLGIVLYEMLAGQVPFTAESSMGVLLKHIQEAPPPIPGLPLALQNVLTRALAKNPEDRYETAREMLRAFLDAAELTLAEVAPGYSLTPQPLPSSVVAEQITLAPPQQTGAEAASLRDSRAAISRKKGYSAVLWLVLGAAALGILSIAALGGFWIFKNVIPANKAAPQAASTFGLLRFYHASGYLDEVIFSATGLPPAPDGSRYEAWLVGDEARRSLGAFQPDTVGNAQVTLVDEQGRNLLARYSQLEITVEPDPDPSPNPAGKAVFSSAIPPLALVHVRHVMVAFPDTPNQTGMLIGLTADARLLNDLSAEMLAAYQNQDAAGVRRNAEALYNTIVGRQGAGYGDLDNDGQISDPSDGFGMLLNGEQEGYVQGTIMHVELADSMADASENVRVHAPHVIDSSKNVEVWASELAALLTQILDDPLGSSAGAKIRQAVALTDRIWNGRDLDGNEKVDPILGEGGILTALEHVTYMIDMPVMAGEGMITPPAGEAPPPHSSGEH